MAEAKNFKELEDLVEKEKINLGDLIAISLTIDEDTNYYIGTIKNLIKDEIGKTGKRDGITFYKNIIINEERVKNGIDFKNGFYTDITLYVYDKSNNWNYDITNDIEKFESKVKEKFPELENYNFKEAFEQQKAYKQE